MLLVNVKYYLCICLSIYCDSTCECEGDLLLDLSTPKGIKNIQIYPDLGRNRCCY